MILSPIVLALAAAPAELPTFTMFGISTEDVDHYPQGRSECMKWDADRLFCVTGWNLGNVRMESISFTYTLGKLSEVHGTAKVGEYQLMLDTLKAKYGEPVGDAKQPTWHFKGGTLTIKDNFQFRSSGGPTGAEFTFKSEENSRIPARKPVVNF